MESKKISNNMKHSMTKKEFLFILIFSILIVFFFFVFKQIDIILNNQSEFCILFKEVIASYIFFAFIVLLINIGVLSTLCYFCKNAFKCIVAILVGLVLASYIQLLFLNGTVVISITGHVTASIFRFITNSLFFIFITLLPLVIYKKYNKKHQTENVETTTEQPTKDSKSTPFAKVIICILTIIFGMQFVGSFSTVTNVEQPAIDNELYYFSIDEQLKLSQNENIIVFVLDRMDTDYINTIFSRYPEDKSTFSGFTLYKDNISQYPGTFPSITSLLTSKVFDEPQTQKEFMQLAWQNPVLFEALRANNYKINGLLNSIASFYDFKEIETMFDNIKILDKDNRKIKHLTFFGKMFEAALNQFMPFSLKLLLKGYIDTPNECIDILNTPDYFKRTVCAQSDLAFYDRLTSPDAGLSAEEEKNVFSFVHFLGSHTPYNYNSNLNYVANGNVISQTRGTYKILQEYFNQMKNLNIYKNSTIIVMADHGEWSPLQNGNGVTEPPIAGLFIKPKGEGENDVNDTTSPLQIDDTTQLSNENFVPTIIEILYNQNNSTVNQNYLNQVKADNYSYFDVEKPVADGGLGGIQDRYYYCVMWTNLNSTTYKYKYKIVGAAKDIDNWTKID